MAQAFFDGHPLEDYLRDSGEVSESILPGTIPEFSLQLCTTPPLLLDPRYSERMERLCYIIISILEFAASLFTPNRLSKRTRAFAERFKYGVISSTLLSPAFPTTPIRHGHWRSLSPSLPGKFTSGHSRTTSLEGNSTTAVTEPLLLSMPSEAETPLWPITLSFTISVAAFSARFYFPSVLMLVSTLYYMRVHRLDLQHKPDIMTPSLEALQTLISAGHVWESVINDAFTLLEHEERSTPYGSTSPSSPAPWLKVTLSSCLLTTQTQCDNVRQLLSAIASPNELSQLSEMYAPSSPIKSTFSLSTGSHRPLSHPGSPERKELSKAGQKRSTWNGSYSALASAGSPPAPQIARRREKRKSDINALLGAGPPSHRSLSTAPMSPSRLQPLADVSEEDSVLAVHPLLATEDEETFGAAALNLHRRRKKRGLRMVELQQRSAPPPLALANFAAHRQPAASPATRYTTMQTARHPLSLSALHQALQSSLASKRFACSHLLALRFEDDDEIYWEDVRSVMSLLTSSLVEASSRISEVLDEAEERHLRLDDSVTEDPSGINTPVSPGSPPLGTASKFPQSFLLGATPSLNSFAPLPSHLARFSAHINAISCALDDAREHLDKCVASLKEDASVAHSQHSSGSCSSTAGEHPAMKAYEYLRRELGLALRECERGRERLVNIVSPPTLPEDVDVGNVTTPLEQNSNAEKPREESLVASDAIAESNMSVTISTLDGEAIDMDGVSDDLLFTTSTELFLPLGIEQVYEADTSNVGAFTRERSKLSREERIMLARARRDAASSGGGNSITDPDSAHLKLERFGPGGEVIQELRDVIWKVGERRRKMTENQLRSVVSNASSSLPSSPQCTAAPVNLLPQSPTLS